MDKKKLQPKKEKKVEEKPPKPIDFLKHYVEPHRKKAREVTEKDLLKVLEDGHILFNLCYTQRNKYSGAFAVAHSQINNKDPLRFFVTKEEEIIINPVVTWHTKVPIINEEGCTSYPDKDPYSFVKRFNKCGVEYYTIEQDKEKSTDDKPVFKLSEKKEEEINGRRSKVFQHEIDHMDGVYIYDDEEV